ncbi:MAG: hypothetical protein ACRDY7_03090 [Acidimicrobiia bacterium]
MRFESIRPGRMAFGRVVAIGGAVLCLAAAGPPVAAEPKAAAVGIQAVRDFAPTVFLHDEEEYQPMAADAFIAGSELRWSHESGCGDDGIAKPPDAKRLGTGGYSHQDKSGPPGCNHQGRQFRSDENVRPKGDGNVADGEGFFLDLDNGARNGEGVGAPVYYDIRGQAIVYWLFYGYSDAAARFNHEGDWETVTVLLGDGRPQQVVYYQHGGPCVVPAEGKRPVAYSARGTHASYPKPGEHPYGPEGAATDTAAAGPRWDTAGNLVPLNTQPWYRYGGGWGEVGEFKDTTGPQGPHPEWKTGVPEGSPAPC